MDPQPQYPFEFGRSGQVAVHPQEVEGEVGSLGEAPAGRSDGT
jgi:hypothetical protein